MQYGECVKGLRQRSHAGGSGWSWWPEVEEGAWPGGAGASARVKRKGRGDAGRADGPGLQEGLFCDTDAFSDTKMAIRSNPNDPDG